MPATRCTALLVVVFLLPAAARGLEQPDCGQLESWASGFADAEPISIAPKVQIPGQLADDKAVPLFGQPAGTWAATDFNRVRSMLNECRRAARKRRDRATSDRLYKAMKAVALAMRPMRDMEHTRARAERAVDNMVNYHKVPELPKVLTLGQRALHGEDVEAELRQLSIGRSFTDHIRTLQQAHEYLPAEEIQALGAKLGAGRQQAAQARDHIREEFEAAKRELAAAPVNQAGLQTLQRLSQLPVLNQIPQQDAIAFQTAVMKKRRLIAYALRQQQAQVQARRAAQPVALKPRLETLFAGAGVEDVSIRDVRPGMAYGEAKQRMQHDWKFGTGAGGDILTKMYGPLGRDAKRYKEQERRDGGLFEFETMDDAVGQVQFIEHYTGPLPLKVAHDWLIERFGKPQQQQSSPSELAMTWSDSGSHLKIRLANHTLLSWKSSRDFKSAMAVTIWNDDYTGFVAKANARCGALRNKPMSELSVQDRMDLLNGCR